MADDGERSLEVSALSPAVAPSPTLGQLADRCLPMHARRRHPHRLRPTSDERSRCCRGVQPAWCCPRRRAGWLVARTRRGSGTLARAVRSRPGRCRRRTLGAFRGRPRPCVSRRRAGHPIARPGPRCTRVPCQSSQRRAAPQCRVVQVSHITNHVRFSIRHPPKTRYRHPDLPSPESCIASSSALWCSLHLSAAACHHSAGSCWCCTESIWDGS